MIIDAFKQIILEENEMRGMFHSYFPSWYILLECASVLFKV